jgi:hypothetical protein
MFEVIRASYRTWPKQVAMTIKTLTLGQRIPIVRKRYNVSFHHEFRQMTTPETEGIRQLYLAQKSAKSQRRRRNYPQG